MTTLQPDKTDEKITTVTVYVDGWPEPSHGEVAFKRELRDLLRQHGMWSEFALIAIENERV